MIIQFDFNPVRYLAQKIPPLYLSSGEGYSHDSSRVFKWPQKAEGWTIPADDLRAITRLQKERPPALKCDKTQTILEVVRELDSWLDQLLRKKLPQQVMEILTTWLTRQWNQYSGEPLPEGYLWTYISILNEQGLKSGESHWSIPPLVGHCEVFAYRWVQSYGPDEWSRDWLDDQRSVHLCERLSELSSDIGRQRGISKKSDEEIPIFLVVEHQGARLARRWLVETPMDVFSPAAALATENGLIRHWELHLLRAKQVVSRTVSNPLARSLARKLPQTWHAVQEAAAEVADQRCRLLPPRWRNDDFLARSRQWSWEKRWPPEERGYSSAGAVFLTEDFPGHQEIEAAVNSLRSKETPPISKEEDEHFNNLFGSWQGAWFILAAVAEGKRQMELRGRQHLLELHRNLTAGLEGVLTRRLEESDSASSDQIQRLFRGWLVETSGMQSEIDRWSPLFNNRIDSGLRPAKAFSGSVPDLADIIFGLCKEPKTGRESGVPEFEPLLMRLLTAELGASDWADAVSQIQGKTKPATAAVLFGGQIILQMRNRLTHGTVAEHQSPAREVVVQGRDRKSEMLYFRLTPRSLDYCFRLLPALICKIHQTTIQEQAGYTMYSLPMRNGRPKFKSSISPA